MPKLNQKLYLPYKIKVAKLTLFG